MLFNPNFHSLGNFAEWRVDGVRNLPKSAHRGVENPTLDPTDVCPIERTIPTEPFLGLARVLPKLAYDSSNGPRPEIGWLNLALAPLLHRQIR